MKTGTHTQVPVPITNAAYAMPTLGLCYAYATIFLRYPIDSAMIAEHLRSD